MRGSVATSWWCCKYWWVYCVKTSALNGTARLEVIFCELLKHRMTLVHCHLGTQDSVHWDWHLQGWRSHNPSVPFTVLTQKNFPYFLSPCSAVKPSPCWDVSFSISWHMCAPSSCWACSHFSVLVSGSPQLDPAHQKQSHSNVKLKEIIFCAHVTQKGSPFCGQVPETSEAIIRAR